MIICLYPVIGIVPDDLSINKGRQKAEALSRLARQCAARSAERSGWRLEQFTKNEAGAPVPEKGIFWSVSHKPKAVAGVAAASHIGIDIEQIRPVSRGVFNRILSPEESLLFSGTDKNLDFYRAFTAKEAVLKHNGKGLGSLSSVQIDSVVDDRNLRVTFSNRKYWVENFIDDSYLASVTKEKSKVEWIIKPAADLTR